MFKHLDNLYQEIISWNDLARDDPPTLTQQGWYCEEEVKELFDAIIVSDLVEEMDALCDIFFTGAYLEHLDPNSKMASYMCRVVDSQDTFSAYCLYDCIEEVIRSNYTKFLKFDPNDHTESFWEEVQNMAEDLTEESGVPVSYEVVECPAGAYEGSYIVFKDINAKVRKPPTYEKPQIKKILENFDEI